MRQCGRITVLALFSSDEPANLADLPDLGLEIADRQLLEEVIADCTDRPRLNLGDELFHEKRAVARSALDESADKAVADYNQTVHLDYARAYLGQCRVMSELGRHEQAIEDFQEAVRVEPDSASVSVDD